MTSGSIVWLKRRHLEALKSSGAKLQSAAAQIRADQKARRAKKPPRVSDDCTSATTSENLP